jgi:hypothetical protein
MAPAGRLAALLGTFAAFAASSALAAPIFTATPSGDWFDDASWSGGTAPTASDAPVIDYGATATASSASPLYPGGGVRWRPTALRSARGSGSGTADGHAVVRSGGINAHQGPVRGDEYSAIDATSAKLAGQLDVQFTAPALLGTYDLLISGLLDGITGDFAGVNVSGLTGNQSAAWVIETTGGATPVEVLRLYVVPEPGTGALLASGLIVLAIRARPSRADG